MSAYERNLRVQGLAAYFLTQNPPTSAGSIRPEIDSDIKLVFACKAKSFREILFTILIARVENAKYKSTVNLYECSPRAVYEQGIRPMLEDRLIPCTQSGPLNVVKATVAISENWATMKIPLNVGKATARLAAEIDRCNPAELNTLGLLMGELFLSEAKAIHALKIERERLADPIVLNKVTKRLMLEASNGGNTAQKIIGFLLKSQKTMLGSDVQIDGLEDSASTTNATAKKIGDLSVSMHGSLIAIFEITLKEFSEQRISECSSSLIGFVGNDFKGSLEVIVLCRKEDVPSLANQNTGSATWLGNYEDRFGIIYRFVEIHEWIAQRILELDENSRMGYFSQVQEYIDRFKTPMEVKKKWNEIMEAESAILPE